MFLNDIDPQFIKSVNYLYTSDNILKGDQVPLQFYLEEAIRNKSGVAKDLSGLVSASFKQRRANDFKPFINTLEESKDSSSDNELELALLNDDLMCIVCNGMDVGARNRLLECSDCRKLYHQECHNPIVTNQDSFDSWICQTCKDSKKQKLPITTTNSTPVTTSGSQGKNFTNSSSKSSSSSSHRHGSSSSSYKSSSSVSKSEKYSKSSSGGSSAGKTSTLSNSASVSSTSKTSTTSSSTSRTNVTPNINIISADKRIQFMKKKAAKMHEKRKHLSR